MVKFLVLGGYGIIGRVVVSDLFNFSNSEIIIAGRDLKKAEEYSRSFKSKRVIAVKIDIKNNDKLAELLINKDVCINCVQYYFNLEIMKACIKAKTNYVDLGGMFHYTKRQLKLSKEFSKIGKCAILGIGASPGITNLLASYAGSKVNVVKNIEIVFADRDKTVYQQNFVLPYSFETLVDEFSMNPAVFISGRTRFVKPGSGIKEYDFGLWGRRKGFLTLHSEIATLPSYFRKKGIKNCEFRVTFPEDFIKTMNNLIELGFTNKENMNFLDKEIKTVEITAKIMNRLIVRPATKVKDQEILQVIVNKKMRMEALTKSDGENSAGVLDTGIPCSIAAQMIAYGIVNNEGVFAPEQIIKPIDFFRELNKRKIKIYENREEII